MSEKFTPGPWEADFIDRDYPSGDFGYWEVYCVPEDRALCDVHGALDRDAANAALIAAAPDLYEALEKLINDLPDCTIDWARDGMGNTNANCIVNSRDNGKAALAKARGE